MKCLPIILLLSGCCTTPIKLIHEPAQSLPPYKFDKFTETEKDTMGDAIGQKIQRNQKECGLRNKRLNDIIQQHNKLHSTK